MKKLNRPELSQDFKAFAISAFASQLLVATPVVIAYAADGFYRDEFILLCGGAAGAYLLGEASKSEFNMAWQSSKTGTAAGTVLGVLGALDFLNSVAPSLSPVNILQKML